MRIVSARDSVFTPGSRQRFDYGSCPVCDAEVNEPCRSVRPHEWGRPISRPHPEREKVPLSPGLS